MEHFIMKDEVVRMRLAREVTRCSPREHRKEHMRWCWNTLKDMNDEEFRQAADFLYGPDFPIYMNSS